MGRIVGKNCLYFGIPKTGCHWTVRVFELMPALRCDYFPGCGMDLHVLPRRLTQPFLDQKFKFTFVRNPLTWLQSRYIYYLQQEVEFSEEGRNNIFSDNMSLPHGLKKYELSTFENFVLSWMECNPGGIVKMFQEYLGENFDRMDFVGKQEKLKYDVVKALIMGGEKFELFNIVDKDPIHRSASLSDYKDRCKYTYVAAEAVIRDTEKLIDQYDYWHDCDKILATCC